MSPGPRLAVIGLGNPFRGDDGVGPAIIAELARCRLPGVTLTVVDGDPTRLLDAWTGTDLAIVVDAVLCEPATPGRIHRTTLDLPSGGAPPAGTHGFGLPQALGLAEALGRAPRRLVVLAVQGADLRWGPGLSPAVGAAIPELLDVILAELAGGPARSAPAAEGASDQVHEGPSDPPGVRRREDAQVEAQGRKPPTR